MSALGKFFAVLILLIFLFLIIAFVAMIVYFYRQSIVVPTQCDNKNLQIPSTEQDAVGCNISGNYNVYTGATISSPQSPTTVFDPVEEEYNSQCAQKCDSTSGCVAWGCTLTEDSTIPTKCTCTGYSQVPTALASDKSANYTTIGIKSDAL